MKNFMKSRLLLWNNANQKAKVIENTLKIGPLKIQHLFQEYNPDLSQNLIQLVFTLPVRDLGDNIIPHF